MNAARHIGHNIGKIRELRGLKQEALAYAIGVSQQTISNIENSKKVDEEKLEKIAQELDVSVEAIKNFSEEEMINYINNFHDGSGGNNFGTNESINFSFNPLEKLIEAHEENKKLYQLLLESEKEKIAYLERLLKEK